MGLATDSTFLSMCSYEESGNYQLHVRVDQAYKVENGAYGFHREPFPHPFTFAQLEAAEKLGVG